MLWPTVIAVATGGVLLSALAVWMTKPKKRGEKR